jgi:polysaccharide biosynthesis protein PslH
MSRVLFITVEPPWPANHGGRIRAARVAEVLAGRHDVLVAFPDHGERDDAAPVPTLALPFTARFSLRTRLAVRPHLGGHYLASVRAALADAGRRFNADLVYWSHSYLAPWAPAELGSVPNVVEFANIESARLRSLTASARGPRRVAREVEARKAERWEPRVARRASLCVALNERDAAVLRQWSARVLLVPNGVDQVAYERSPRDGYVLALASYDYQPNVEAILAVLREVWPAVRRQRPEARLVIAGRRSERLPAEVAGTPGVEILGTLDRVDPAYRGAAVTLALAATGGGSQLKVTESLARGRCAVLSSFAAAGLPPALAGGAGCLVAADDSQAAAHILQLLSDVDDRWKREQAGWEDGAALNWPSVVSPLVGFIGDLASAGGRP